MHRAHVRLGKSNKGGRSLHASRGVWMLGREDRAATRGGGGIAARTCKCPCRCAGIPHGHIAAHVPTPSSIWVVARPQRAPRNTPT